MAAMSAVVLQQFCRCLGIVGAKSGAKPFVAWRNFMTATSPHLFRATFPLEAEPMKKKKKMDLNIIVQREQKRRKKIEKQIKKLELKGLQLKPIDEIEGDRSFIKTLDKRKRDVPPQSFEELEDRALLLKDWTRYKRDQFIAETNAILRVQRAQRMALEELKQESLELYELAIQIDEGLIPFDWTGPVETPPIKGYVASDGECVDTTKKFDK